MVNATPLLLTLGIASCGDDFTGPVADLPDEDAVALCRDFLATVCDGSIHDFCTECQGSNLCDHTALVATMDAQCAPPITAEQVVECAESARGVSEDTDPTICSEGGGCMFDVGDQLCFPAGRRPPPRT